MSSSAQRSSPSGHYSPLRYPGGKGKLARFVANVIKSNRLQDGMYVEPYAGGAAVALELLLTGVVRNVMINDLNRPIYQFWHSILHDTTDFIGLIKSTSVDMNTRNRAKRVLMNSDSGGIDLAFAVFFLNRTNRSGILNGGPIGGIAQDGAWRIDARYNKENLINRINNISKMRKRISLSNCDALSFLKGQQGKWPKKTLVYLDPPYYVKGRDLYDNFYEHSDHSQVAELMRHLRDVSWVVSYDDVEPIHGLYSDHSCLRYSIGYSARNYTRGGEAMFFSHDLAIPEVHGSMSEIARYDRARETNIANSASNYHIRNA